MKTLAVETVLYEEDELVEIAVHLPTEKWFINQLVGVDATGAVLVTPPRLYWEKHFTAIYMGERDGKYVYWPVRSATWYPIHELNLAGWVLGENPYKEEEPEHEEDVA